jgi:hypothetical protein
VPVALAGAAGSVGSDSRALSRADGSGAVVLPCGSRPAGEAAASGTVFGGDAKLGVGRRRTAVEVSVVLEIAQYPSMKKLSTDNPARASERTRDRRPSRCSRSSCARPFSTGALASAGRRAMGLATGRALRAGLVLLVLLVLLALSCGSTPSGAQDGRNASA